MMPRHPLGFILAVLLLAMPFACTKNFSTPPISPAGPAPTLTATVPPLSDGHY